jgi:hypothetical protein
MNKSKNRNNWKNSVTRNWTYFFSNMYISSYFGIQNGRKKPLAIAEKTTSKKKKPPPLKRITRASVACNRMLKEKLWRGFKLCQLNPKNPDPNAV